VGFSFFYFSSQYIYELNILDSKLINLCILIILLALTFVGVFILISLSKNIFYEICGSKILENYTHDFQTTYNAKDLIMLRYELKKLTKKEKCFFDEYYYYLKNNDKSGITYDFLSEWITKNNNKDIESEKNNILFIVMYNLNNKDFEIFFKSYKTDNIKAIRLLWENKELRSLIQKRYLHLYDSLNNKLIIDKVSDF
jgi:hypothetical protein